MRFFDFLFGSRSLVVSDPSRLKQALFDAIQRHDQRRLAKLCRGNQQAIVQNFPLWQKVPDDILKDPVAIQPYMSFMIGVAEFFALRLNAPQLMERLIGTQENNPLLRWQKQLAAARELMSQMRYQDARGLLTDLLIDVRELKGTGADTYLPLTFGHLGDCCFNLFDAKSAIPHFESALQHCEQSQDHEGVIAYLGNLYEAHRYLDHKEEAGAYAERLAASLETQNRHNEAQRYRTQARIVRAGEPLNRVVIVTNGVQQELDAARMTDGVSLQVVFERNRLTLWPARELTRQGEQLGSQGKYEESLAFFRDAAKADPFDPHSRYQLGYSLLHLQRFNQAVESYEETEALAPGWFHCRSDLWMAQQLAIGKLNYEVAGAVLLLEDSPLPPAESLKIAEQIVARAPDFAPAQLLLGSHLAKSGRSREALACLRKGLATVEEPDIETRLLVEIAILLPEGEERRSLLEKACDLNGNLVAAAQATLILGSTTS